MNHSHYGLTPPYTYMAITVGGALYRAHLFIAGFSVLGHIIELSYYEHRAKMYPTQQNPSEKEDQLLFVLCMVGQVDETHSRAVFSGENYCPNTAEQQLIIYSHQPFYWVHLIKMHQPLYWVQLY